MYVCMNEYVRPAKANSYLDLLALMHIAVIFLDHATHVTLLWYMYSVYASHC